ncbi:MAG TPA: tRNA (adenosine(37)-N6)-dimethylallyltransferase MiaA, partial [Candidatus Omnitrophota bacterium]|nr:tRNA (adenosine(37)-N6)-dimethylallyltransferase MiaA [Candidatus Omnitrophota bacterium]
LRNKVKHHLLGVIPLNRDYDVSAYRKEALKKVKEIASRGKVPLFVGGTGLYLSVLKDGIFEEKINDKPIRDKLYRIAVGRGSLYLYDQLKKVDPDAAEKIHPNDTKRIIRALGVFKATGRPISSLQKKRQGLRGEYDLRIICLNMERSKLYKKIDKRVDLMFKDGLIKEAQGILKKDLSRTASFAIGLREAEGYLKGDYGIEEAKARVKLKTRRYAKRQLTWFRKDKEIIWINLREEDTPVKISRRIWKELF